ncbi:MAG: hypothetical protein HKM28_07295 [Flavobacteriaceae bacterium]|nr:hypothetical protein [Flavobacteriaceae bacterium]
MKVFVEEQKFTQWWLKIVLGIVALATLSPILFYKENTIETTTPIIPLITVGVITVALVIGIFVVLKLKTRIDEQGIHYAFVPFHRKMRSIPWNSMSECKVRTYEPITEYGGWGYRITLGKNGKAFNVRGNKGIQITQTNNKRLLIGTQEPEKAQTVINRYFKS